MSPTVARLVCNAGAMIGESPLWSGGQVLWTDPLATRLLLYSNETLRRVPTGRPVWALAGLPGGGICGTLDDAFCAIDATGATQAGVEVPIDAGCRFND